jgi:hypothetical protein
LRDNSKLRIRSTEFKAWSCPFCPFVVDPDAPRPWINRRLHLRGHGARGQKLLDEARGVPAGSKRASDIKLALAETRKRQGEQWLETWNEQRPSFAHILVRKPVAFVSPSCKALGGSPEGSFVYGCTACRAGCVANPLICASGGLGTRNRLASTTCTALVALRALKGLRKRTIDKALGECRDVSRAASLETGREMKRSRIMHAVQRVC